MKISWIGSSDEDGWSFLQIIECLLLRKLFWIYFIRWMGWKPSFLNGICTFPCPATPTIETWTSLNSSLSFFMFSSGLLQNAVDRPIYCFVGAFGMYILPQSASVAIKLRYQLTDKCLDCAMIHSTVDRRFLINYRRNCREIAQCIIATWRTHNCILIGFEN